jgi:ATP-dependent Clp protease ATP-binding subunit ClpC
MTGVPIFKLEQKDSERLLKIEEELGKNVIGQEEAIKSIARAIRRARAGIKEPRRPIGSFIFLGPTGVGKTLLARALTEFMFGSDESLIQLDMSEYMEKFNISRLIGAPPGYVGFDEGGQLTERVRRKPYAVVLLDELEKAHPDVFNILLQILEEGRLTDSYGRRVDFRNVVLIMTSNVGANLIKKHGALGFTSQDAEINYEDIKSKLFEEVKRKFKPELLNRLDETIVFQPLNKEALGKIIDVEMANVNKRLADKKLELILTPEAKEFFMEKGFDPVFGARPLKRVIQRFLEDPLAEDLIKGEFSGKDIKPGETIKITIKRKGDELRFA